MRRFAAFGKKTYARLWLTQYLYIYIVVKANKKDRNRLIPVF